MSLGLLTLHVQLPGCSNLKEKRSRLKPLLVRLRREFNVSVAEMELLDKWDEAILACALVSNGQGHIQHTLQIIVTWIEKNWPDVLLIDHQIEMR